MFNPHIIRAWRWLLAHMVLATVGGYLLTLIISWTGLAKPTSILRTVTSGIRHVGGPITEHGVAFGLDQGIMIFLCNMTVAMLIVTILFCASLLNPYSQDKSFRRLRRHLQKDCAAERLRIIPVFSGINSSQLRLSSFLLLGAPYIATICLGLMAGTLLGTVHLLSSSPLIAMAYILPHGIPEIAALLLACSIPVGTWLAIRPVAGNEHPVAAFRRIDRMVASRELQQNLKLIVTLLMIAGMIEAHLTLKVVELFKGI